MAQPSGRGLSLPAKYRTYLRCSPVICAADALSILIHFIYYCATFSPQDAVRFLIQERFGDDEDDAEGIQAVEKLTFIRWMFFVFGTLGSGIKLMAMENIPWTKAWGAMFLISFIVVEVLVILSWIYVPHGAAPLLEGQEAAQLLRVKARLEKFDNVLMPPSTIFYVLVLLFAAWEICFKQYRNKSFASLKYPDDGGDKTGTGLLSLLIFFAATLYTSLIIYMSWADFAEAYPRIGRNLFITWKSQDELAESTDEERDKWSDGWQVLTIFCFLMFLCSSVLCLIWYAYR